MRRALWLSVGLVLAALTGVVVAPHGATDPVIRTVSVGQIPGMVAVDAHTNRAFVLNSRDNTVSVLDARSGTLLRTVALNRSPETAIVATRTDRVFVLNDESDLVSVLDAARGTVLRTLSVASIDAAVDERSSHVFVAGDDALTMLDARSGRVLDTERLSAGYAQGIAVDPRTQRAFVTNFGDDTVSVADTTSGHVVRVLRVGRVPVAVAVDVRTGRAFVTNNGSGSVSMLDARSGALLRTIPVGPTPARVVVAERVGRVFIVHGRGGNVATPAGVFAGPSWGGTTMLDARTGAVLRRIAIGGSPLDDVGYATATNIAVDESGGHVFVINQSTRDRTGNPTGGSVSVLDDRTGQVRQTIAVGLNPIALAVDEASARLFVVSTNSGCIRRTSIWDQVPPSVRSLLPFLPKPAPPICNAPGTVTVIDTSRV
jgi:YVTN family beta-propeller protein